MSQNPEEVTERPQPDDAGDGERPAAPDDVPDEDGGADDEMPEGTRVPSDAGGG
jgi:hypothetical protein